MAVNRMATYGIGVQNRYSAFLEDEDGFLVVAASGAKRIEHAPHLARSAAAAPTLAKQKVGPTSQVSGSKQNNSSASASGDAASNKAANKAGTNQTLKGAHLNGEHQHKRTDGKHQRASHQQQQQPNQHGANNFVLAPRQTSTTNNGKQGNLINNQENTANQGNNRFVRTHNANANNNHQSNVSQQQQQRQQQQNKETNDLSHQTGGKFARNSNGQRPQATGNNRRQFNHDDMKNKASNGQTDEGNARSLGGPGIGDEEKRRRQQKRALDMKHKDQEKREARRQQQQHGASSTMEQAAGDQTEQTQGELGGHSRGHRGGRLQDGGLAEDGDRGFKTGGAGGGSRGGRRRRNEAPGAAGAIGPKGPGGERRGDGQQQQTNQRVPRNGGDDRPPRNRNGFGAGSKGSGRGVARGDGDQGKYGRRDSGGQKPIPNFSDKQDFPSLAS